ncbi:Adiponectin receptor protein [Clonorchis sinensis]|uniref:Adiponectin receptor protein n=1 Tax=Clonorchis sinensis TaxID=79923 RepID=A0A8T1MMP7_CLOSI|nr:Adiponectin receptor protein [Clonorchis sinensis]
MAAGEDELVVTVRGTSFNCPPTSLVEPNTETLEGSQDMQLVEDENSKVHCVNYQRVKDFTHLMHTLAQSAEEYARQIWMRGWQVVHFQRLPTWLKDNEMLLRGHRPQLYTVWACFASIFRVHTETGNIWTHLLGCAGFIAISTFILLQPSALIQWQEKLIFSGFFFGAILCLGFSCLFHTVLCHSESISRILNKLDYCGIAFLTMGSFVPYLYYSFYCVLWLKLFYLALIFALGSGAIAVSMSNTFASPAYRPLRALVFIALGLSGVIPCVHVTITNGFWPSLQHGSLGWLFLMAVLYITGASIYAVRVPERIFPGRFDIWFQSHQIFHVFVVAAALVHYHGIIGLTNYRLAIGDCRPPPGYPFPKHDYDNIELLRPFMTY